ncbi:MAG: hypothetical protein RR036_03440 [Oscillospiraceae bacterium]
MQKSTRKVAFCGIVTGLAIVSMFLGGLIPFAEYTFPAISGILFVAIVIEYSKKTAFIAYVAVSLLSIFLAPNKEMVVIFIGFLGYYPIVKSYFETTKSRVTEWVLKMISFNIAVIISYVIAINLFGMKELLSDMQNFMKYGIIALLALANVVFVIYDIALTRLIAYYINVLRPKVHIKGK